MTEEAQAVTDEPQIPLTREFTVDAGYAGRAARALTWRYLSRRVSFWGGVAVTVVAAALALAGVGVMWWVAGAMTLLTLLLPVALYFPTRRQFTKLFPPGTVLRMGFGETRFRSDGPEFSSTVNYTFYSKVERVGEFVGMRAAKAAWSYFPGSMFTDEDLARFPRGS